MASKFDKQGNIESIAASIFNEISPPRPLYLMIDPDLGREVASRWMVELAQAVATLYVGYKLGSQIEDVGQALVRTLDAIADVAKSIARVIEKLGEIIDAINRLLEALSKKIDSAFMTMHLNKMKAKNLTMTDILTKLKALPHDATDSRVSVLLVRLQSQQDELFDAIIQYQNQEDGRPSPAAFIGCAPAMALWAQSYTVIERYKPQADRLPPWETASQQEMHTFVEDFFTDYIRQRGICQTQLDTMFLVPEKEIVRTFDGQFKPSRIAKKGRYPNEPMYYGLYSRDSFDPFSIYSTAVFTESPIPRKYVGWAAVYPSNYPTFPSPDSVKAADSWHVTAREERQKRHRFLQETEKFEAYKAESLTSMAPQADW